MNLAMNLTGRCIACGLFVAALTGAAQAEQAADRAERAAKSANQPLPVRPSERIAVSILDGRDVVWSGTLRISAVYGSASFSQSKNEAAEPCPGEARSDSNQRSSSESMNFSISRYNWQQEPDRFNISLNWTVPVAACQDEGNDSFGFNRTVTVPQGQTVTVAGSGRLSLRVTRPQ
jgi:hypothetical protein